MDIQQLKDAWETAKGDENTNYGTNEAEAYIAALEAELKHTQEIRDFYYYELNPEMRPEGYERRADPDWTLTPEQTAALSPEQLEELGRLAPGAPSIAQLINEDRGD